MSINSLRTLPFRSVWAIGFALMVLLLLVSAYAVHKSQLRHREHVERELQVINQMQRQGVQTWYDQRLTDAASLMDDESLGELAAVLLRSEAPDPSVQTRLQRRLRSLLEQDNYTGVWLLDAAGEVRLSPASVAKTQAPAMELQKLSQAFLQAEAVIVPPREDDAFEHPFLSVLVPIFHQHKQVAAIWLVMDLRLSLYPILERWPVRSTTAGSTLLRRGNDKAIYLSPAGGPDDGLESLHLPLTETASPAVQAVMGMRGLYTGVEPDGKTRIAVASSLRSVPWVLLSTVELDEALHGEWNDILWLIAPIVLTLLVMGIVLFYVQHVAWRRERTLKQALQEQVRTDALTGVFNRLALNERLGYEWQRAARQGSELSILMVDIDHFKQYNDYYGHLRGDEALRQVASLISAVITRSVDMVARYGGEEFVVVLPDTDGEQAVGVAEHICQSIRQAAIAHQHPQVQATVTVSIGVAASTPGKGHSRRAAHDVTALLRQADAALYQAKENNRDQVVLYQAGERVSG